MPAPLDAVVVLTSHGTVLAIEPDTGRPVQAPFPLDEDQACFWSRSDKELRAPPGTGGRAPPSWRLRGVGDRDTGVLDLVAVETGPGTFLRAPPHLGMPSLDAPEAAGWERFCLLPAEAFRLLCRLAAARWLIDLDDRPTDRLSLRLAAEFRVEFGGRSMVLQDLLRAVRDATGPRTRDGLPMSFTFFHGACSASRALLFNPLVYGTISGGDHFFEQIALCFRSFERFGEYDGTYRLVCDRDRDGAALCFHGFDDTRWDSVRRDMDGLGAIVSARMTILSDPEFDGFQPILYVDSDVVCDRPIEGLLVAATRSERILIATEFHGRTIEEVGLPHGNWFGLFLQDADPRIGLQQCINNGIFAARNRQTFDGPFAAVAESWRRFRAAHGDAHRAAYDQPFYSSVLQSLDAADTASMNRWVHTLQGVEPTDSHEALGLAHFNVGVGMDKTQAMLRYFGMLERRRLPRRSAA